MWLLVSIAAIVILVIVIVGKKYRLVKREPRIDSEDRLDNIHSINVHHDVTPSTVNQSRLAPPIHDPSLHDEPRSQTEPRDATLDKNVASLRGYKGRSVKLTTIVESQKSESSSGSSLVRWTTTEPSLSLISNTSFKSQKSGSYRIYDSDIERDRRE